MEIKANPGKGAKGFVHLNDAGRRWAIAGVHIILLFQGVDNQVGMR